jgi:hypothetical protein
VGLPVVVLLPKPPEPSLGAGITTPSGSIDDLSDGQLCIVDKNDHRSTNPVYGPTGADILRVDNAVFLVPASPLVSGQYRVTVSEEGQPAIAWSFRKEPGTDV